MTLQLQLQLSGLLQERLRILLQFKTVPTNDSYFFYSRQVVDNYLAFMIKYIFLDPNDLIKPSTCLFIQTFQRTATVIRLIILVLFCSTHQEYSFSVTTHKDTTSGPISTPSWTFLAETLQIDKEQGCNGSGNSQLGLHHNLKKKNSKLYYRNFKCNKAPCQLVLI